ncbi:MAG: sulfatase [Bacteroidetes bacterium]|nr:sulfatase [Bacteroidota bacterium]
MNVILFVVDDLGYYDLSVTGSKLYETPNIDQLAKSGMQFQNAYVSHPRCVPSRFSLQTGKYPARLKIPGGKGQMKTSEVTIGEAFKEAGYTTFFAGKWHLGKDASQWPQNQGYDINIGGCHAGAPPSYFFPYNIKKEGDKSNHSGIVGLEAGEEGEYITDRLTNETVNFITNHKNETFFAVLCHYAVHTPLQAKKEKIEKYKAKIKKMNFDGPEYITKDGTTKMRQDNAIYAAMIESMDESLGELVKTLKQEGIYDNTIIVFTSDHGGLSNRGATNKRVLATSNLPLRAGKGHVYEGGAKVPFFVYWPGVIQAETYSDQVTVNTDIFPTLLDVSGIPLKPESHLDGLSMLPAIKDKKSVERTLFWHSPVGRPESTGDENCSAVRVGDYKLIDFYDKNQVELYNLKTDPNETNNLVSSEKELSRTLLEKLNNWKSKVNAVHKKVKK